MAKMMLLPQVTSHFSIHTFFIKSYTCFITILYSYGTYCGFLQQTGCASPMSMYNSYPRIVSFAPSLKKQSQYFFTIEINCSFISGITLLFNLICLCRYSLCYSSFNVIKYVRLPYSHVCFVLYTVFMYF